MQTRHVQVEEKKAGLKCLHRLRRGQSIGVGGHNSTSLGLQQGAQTAADDFVIISNDYSCHLTDGTGRGNSAVSRVPWPGWEMILSLPPARFTRSRIPVIPKVSWRPSTATR